jgi:hypothetical protein
LCCDNEKAIVRGSCATLLPEALGSFDALGEVDFAVHGDPFLIVVSVQVSPRVRDRLQR